MTEDERREHLEALDDELLKGGIILSEWCSIVIRRADTAFVNGAHLAAMLAVVSAIEAYLRSERSPAQDKRLVDLIDHANIDSALASDLRTLRRYRNRWVHIDDLWDDSAPLASPDLIEEDLERMASFALRVLRGTIYNSQWV